MFTLIRLLLTLAAVLATLTGRDARPPSRRPVTYGRLSSLARATIQDHGVSVAAYVRHHDPDGAWRGDRCGCPDDRCRGHHHDPGEECGCLPVVLAEMIGAGSPDPAATSDQLPTGHRTTAT